MTAGEVNRDPLWRQAHGGLRPRSLRRQHGQPGPRSTPKGSLRFLDSLHPGMRSSMQKDVAAGNPPELDAIAGPILRGAQQHGLDVPVTRELVEMISRKENRLRRPAVDAKGRRLRPAYGTENTENERRSDDFWSKFSQCPLC